jgi:conjugal transfer pilus assembly protein TrbC
MMQMAHSLESKSENYQTQALNSKVKLVSTSNKSLTQRQVQEYQKNLTRKLQQYQQLAINSQKVISQKAQAYKGDAINIAKVATDRLLKPIRDNSQPGSMIIFVSLSMPTESLAEIVNQAYKYNIPVVIRGLYKNTYKSTVQRIQDVLMKISRTNQVGGISVDPNWFDIYNIKKVPAFVLTDKLASCDTQNLSTCKVPNYDVLYGNITVSSALKEFVNRGEFNSLAHRILTKGNLNA